MKNKHEQISKSDAVININRNDFGDGEFGEHCFLLIQQGIPCDAIVGSEGEPCGKRAIGTTDFDVIGDPTILGHCCEEHHHMIISGVRKDLQAIGRDTVFSRNGWKRNAGVLFSRE